MKAFYNWLMEKYFGSPPLPDPEPLLHVEMEEFEELSNPKALSLTEALTAVSKINPDDWKVVLMLGVENCPGPKYRIHRITVGTDEDLTKGLDFLSRIVEGTLIERAFESEIDHTGITKH